MAGNTVAAMKVAGWVTALGVLIGFLLWAFEPAQLRMWGVQVPKLAAVFLLPGIGFMVSLLLTLVVNCDSQIQGHSPASRASIAATIVLPTAVTLFLHIVVLWAGIAGHTLTSSPLTVCAGLAVMALGGVFAKLETNYVVGIRDIWTLRSEDVWQKTHTLASTLFVVAGAALVVLAFFVPVGFWQFATILAVLAIVSVASVCYSYAIREDFGGYSYIVR